MGKSHSKECGRNREVFLFSTVKIKNGRIYMGVFYQMEDLSEVETGKEQYEFRHSRS